MKAGDSVFSVIERSTHSLKGTHVNRESADIECGIYNKELSPKEFIVVECILRDDR